MKKSLKSIFSSCLGTLIAFLVLIAISYAVFSIMIAQSKKPPKINPQTVLRLSLNKEVPERTNNVQFETFEWKNEDILGLHDLLYVLEKAKSDDNIVGVFLDADMVDLGLAGIRSLREGLIDFRQNGKFLFAHSNFYSQGAYYLATAADSIYLNPMGIIEFRGFAAQIPFYKNMLEKVGVEMEVFYAGKFKSASEPYRQDHMSDENRFQIREYVDEIYGRFLADISKSRNIPIPELQKLIANWDGSSDKLCMESGLISRIAYQDEAIDVMRERLGLGPKDKIKTITPEKYFLAHPPKKNQETKDKIAILYAEGGFIGGNETGGAVAEKHYLKMIRNLRREEQLKAIVLRVNSGGGSAMTSENIWRELQLAKLVDSIPIIVSMGDVAASAAYMISAVGDSIFAEENTLTGSIGVYGMMPTVQKLLNDKIGVSYDTVLTGPLSAGFSPLYTFSEQERQIMQNRVDESYASFLQKVADGRGKTVQQIHDIAQGRVWTGPKAVEIGLVDRLGTLEEAISSAANLAGIETYQINEFPKTKNPFQQLIGQIMDPEQTKIQQQAIIRRQLGEWYPYYEFLYEINTNKGPQARLPFFIHFN